MAALNFNASEVDPDEGQLGPVPAGWYIVVMDKSELKPTSNGAGEYLNCRFSVVDGEYKNRKIFTNLNLKSTPSAAPQSILRAGRKLWGQLRARARGS